MVINLQEPQDHSPCYEEGVKELKVELGSVRSVEFEVVIVDKYINGPSFIFDIAEVYLVGFQSCTDMVVDFYPDRLANIKTLEP